MQFLLCTCITKQGCAYIKSGKGWCAFATAQPCLILSPRIGVSGPQCRGFPSRPTPANHNIERRHSIGTNSSGRDSETPTPPRPFFWLHTTYLHFQSICTVVLSLWPLVSYLVPRPETRIGNAQKPQVRDLLLRQLDTGEIGSASCSAGSTGKSIAPVPDSTYEGFVALR